MYDALTSTRPYKKAYSPAIAYNIMANCSAGQFDERLLKFFFSNVAIYPVGAVLKTTAGYGIVKEVRFGHTDRPRVIMFADASGQNLAHPYEEDLSEQVERHIDTVVDDVDLYNFIRAKGFDPASLLKEYSA